MNSIESETEKLSNDLPALEHWGLQLLRMAATLDQLNDCHHRWAPVRGDPNRCSECGLLLSQLQGQVFLTAEYLRRGQFFSPSEIRRHLDLPPPKEG